jgi:hypothetical protein
MAKNIDHGRLAADVLKELTFEEKCRLRCRVTTNAGTLTESRREETVGILLAGLADTYGVQAVPSRIVEAIRRGVITLP